MISAIRLRFGPAPGVSGGPIPVTPVTVFVGPNNSGKSKVLSEIERFSSSGSIAANDVILRDVHFESLSDDAARSAVANITVGPNPNETQIEGHIFVQSAAGRAQLPSGELFNFIRNPNQHTVNFTHWFLRHLILKLDGPGRTALIANKPAGDLRRKPTTGLQVLFCEDEKRKEVRRILYEAFGSYFVVDPTQLGQLRIRYSPREPANDMEERNIHADGIAFHGQATPIEMFSDGVKAFTGIILELIAGDPRILLIDEPEAFLHPSLASKLGYEIARAAVKSDKRVFASTHSPQFLMGCIQSGAPITIVRLTYRSGAATARVLPSTEILELMRNPLL